MIGLILFPCIFLGTHLVLLIWKLMSFGSGNLCDFLCAKLSLLSELSVFWVFDSRDSSSDFLIPSLLCFSHPFALISIDCLTISSGSTELLISAVIFLVSQSSFFFFFPVKVIFSILFCFINTVSLLTSQLGFSKLLSSICLFCFSCYVLSSKVKGSLVSTHIYVRPLKWWLETAQGEGSVDCFSVRWSDGAPSPGSAPTSLVLDLYQWVVRFPREGSPLVLSGGRFCGNPVGEEVGLRGCRSVETFS